MKNYLILSILGILLSSCSFFDNEEPAYIEDKDGVVIKMPFLWKYTYDDKTPTYGYTLPIPSANYNNIVLTGFSKGAQKQLVGIDVGTGKAIWKQNLTDEISNANGYSYMDYVVLPFQQKHSVYSISSGQKLYDVPQILAWKGKPQGNKEEYCFVANDAAPNDATKMHTAYKAKLGNQQTEMIFSLRDMNVPIPNESEVSVAMPINFNQTDYLAIVYNLRLIVENKPKYVPRIRLVNKSTSVVEYDTLLSSHSMTTNNACFSGEYLYVLGVTELVCFDLTKRTTKWTKQAVNSELFNFYDLGLYDDVLVMNVISDEARIMAIDKISGNELWRVPTDNVFTLFHELNGILYYPTKQHLYAIDVLTGNLLWKLDPPEQLGEWSYYCNVVPGINNKKGRIVVNTVSYTYCYQAIR